MSNLRSSGINIKLSKDGSSLQGSTPVTLKNQIKITSIEDINDVSEVEVAAGATLVYNPQNDKYEIRKLTTTDLPETLNLDGGEF